MHPSPHSSTRAVIGNFLLLLALLCGYTLAAKKPGTLSIAPVFHGASVKNEDWGPGGANPKNAAPAKPAKP